MKYFASCKTVEALKREYKKLALEFHPDVSGRDTTKIMQEINAEYDKVFDRVKNVHEAVKPNADGSNTYTAKEDTQEKPEDFRNIIDALLKMQGVSVELCGRWLWITGDTKPHKDALKAAGCKWSQPKLAWYWHFPEDASRNRNKYSLDEIRSFYGSKTFGAEEEEQQRKQEQKKITA